MYILEKIEDDYRIAHNNLDDAKNKQSDLDGFLRSSKEDIESVDRLSINKYNCFISLHITVIYFVFNNTFYTDKRNKL